MTLPDGTEDICMILQKHRFRIDSLKEYPFSLVTDKAQGLMFKDDGSCAFYTGKGSVEVLGKNIERGSREPAKLIQAENGDILLEAKGGDIVLRGANIRIEGNDALGGQVVIDSNKTLQLNAPTINGQGDNINLSGASTVSVGGGTAVVHGEMSSESTTGTDIVKASIFGKILSAIKKFSEFFSSICG